MCLAKSAKGFGGKKTEGHWCQADSEANKGYGCARSILWCEGTVLEEQLYDWMCEENQARTQRQCSDTQSPHV